MTTSSPGLSGGLTAGSIIGECGGSLGRLFSLSISFPASRFVSLSALVRERGEGPGPVMVVGERRVKGSGWAKPVENVEEMSEMEWLCDGVMEGRGRPVADRTGVAKDGVDAPA